MVDILPFNHSHALLGEVLLLVLSDVRILYSFTNKLTTHAAHLLIYGGYSFSMKKPLTIGLLGFGHKAKYLYDKINADPRFDLRYVYVRNLKKELPEEFFVIHHHVAEELEVIYLWIVPIAVEGKNVPISYEVPYTQEMQEKLDDYQKKVVERGSLAIIRGFRQDDEDTDFELYYFVKQKYLQKDSNDTY